MLKRASGRMLLSHICKFIYLKTRKTAGTSLEIYFEPFCIDPKNYNGENHHRDSAVSEWGIVGTRGKAEGPWFNHMSGAQVRAGVGEQIWEDYFKFCAVRNPFDKTVSYFWHELTPELRQRLREVDFSEVRAAFDAWTELRRFPFDAFIYTLDGAAAVDDFIRYEHMQADTSRICRALNIPWQPERLRRYKGDMRLRSEGFEEYYTPASAARVAKAFAWELEFFQYPDITAHHAPRPRSST
jgi:hypothetical protein